MPGRFPQRGRKDVPVDREGHNQKRSHHESRHAGKKNGEKASDIVAPFSTSCRGEEAKRNSDALGKAECQKSQRQRNRKPLSNDVVDAVIAVFQRRTKIAVSEVNQVAEVLFPDWLIQVIFG